MASNTLLQRINQHQHLKNLRNKLLKLHKVLLDAERITYEQASGRISSGEFLQLVISHEQFAWLHSISEVIVQIDEILTADEPISPDYIKHLLVDIRTLLSPSEDGNTFARKYYTALQGEPGVVLAHAEVSQILASA